MWQELGIAETRDTREIRRAYAARLREISGDTDPQAFRLLRGAYERALRFAQASTQSELLQVNASQIIFPDATEPEANPPVPIKSDEGPNVSVRPQDTDNYEQELADQLREFRKRLAERAYDQAFIIYDRMGAKGLLPLHRSPIVADELMAAVMRDGAFEPNAFLQLMQRLGWDTVYSTGQRMSPARYAAIQRLDAERWYQRLMRSAAGKPEIKSATGTRLAVALRNRATRKAAIRNARLLLGRRQVVPDVLRVSITSVEYLERLIEQTKTYNLLLGNRIEARRIARAERMIAREKWSGKTLRFVLRTPIFALTATVIVAAAGSGYPLIFMFAMPLIWGARFASSLMFR